MSHSRHIGLKKQYVLKTGQFGSLPGLSEHGVLAVDTDNSSRWTYELSRKHRDIAHAATNIEDPHPSDDAGIPKEPFGERCEEASLTNQPEMFGVSVAKNVSHVRQVPRFQQVDISENGNVVQTNKPRHLQLAR
jgi:hypothetical protein